MRGKVVEHQQYEAFDGEKENKRQTSDLGVQANCKRLSKH